MGRRNRKNRSFYANNTDPYVPEFWAMESIAILQENMVMANLVHRDFSPIIASAGDVVNTRKPGAFTAKRKIDADSVTIQDATATNVQVPLNQHFHTSFMIKDGEESKSMKDLITEYVSPAMLSIAQAVDKVILGQHPQFWGSSAGQLGQMSSSNARDYMLDARERLNITKAYPSDRRLILGPVSETYALKVGDLLTADKVGDNGTALRRASLGQKFGFDIFMCQNMSSVLSGNTGVTGAVNNAAGYAAGAVTMTVDGLSAALINGSFFSVIGDGIPHRITSSVGGATPTSITFTPALKRAVADNAVISVLTPGAVNLGAGYTAGWAKEIVVDGFTVAPQIGQPVAFGGTSATAIYTIIDVTGLTGITLDRPLDAAIADNDVVNIGPVGQYNFAFHRNAIALVTRPLATPREGTGARAYVANWNGLSMRAVITYDGERQGHLVTLDMLCGIAVLDTGLGAVMFG